MKDLQQKVKPKKDSSLFRLSDFIPGRGLRNYEARNPPEFEEKYPPGFLRSMKELCYEGVKTHKNILEIYNFTLGLIAEWALYYSVIKPLGDYILENIFK